MKLVLNEADSKEARTAVANALKKGYSIHTVDVALAEALNAIWKHVNILKDLNAEEGMLVVNDLMRVYDRLNIVNSREIIEEAARIAFALNTSVYDSLFIVAALRLNGTLYTADQKLCSIIRIGRRDVITKLLKPNTSLDSNSSDAKNDI